MTVLASLMVVALGLSVHLAPSPSEGGLDATVEPGAPDVDAAGSDPDVDPEDGRDDATPTDAGSTVADEPEADAEATTSSDAAAAEPGSASGAGDGSEAPPPLLLPSRDEPDEDDVDDEPLDDDRRRRRARGSRGRSDPGEWRAFAAYPELGPIRYRDPEERRTLWLSADVAGAYVPASLGVFDRTVWTVRPGGAWALALTPWLTAGGRHGVAWYDADNIRIRVHAHQIEVSSRPAAATRSVSFDDRLAVGVSTHAIRMTDVDGFSLKPGGLLDTIIHVDYGLDHLLGTRWRLGWKVQGRYAWVYLDTQRQVRASTRLAFHPRPPHRLSLEAVGYYVHRDRTQAGNPLPRNSLYGQFALGYSWMSRAGVGPWTQIRANTGFMSGEAPVYEIREEALNAAYGEVLVGMLARWP